MRKINILEQVEPYSTLGELLRWRAHNQAEQRAYSYLLDGESEEVHLTYAEMDRRARAIAGRLREMGASGKRVLLLHPPGLEYAVSVCGCLYADVIAVVAFPPPFIQSEFGAGSAIGEFARVISPTTHFESIGRGVIDLRNVYYFVAMVGLFLYLNVRVIDLRRWR